MTVTMCDYVIIFLILFIGSASGDFFIGPFAYAYNEDQTTCFTTDLEMTSDMERCSLMTVAYEDSDPSAAMLFYFVLEGQYINYDNTTMILRPDLGVVHTFVNSNSGEYIATHDMLSQLVPVYLTSNYPVTPGIMAEGGCLNASLAYSPDTCSDPALWTFVRTCSEMANCTNCVLSDDRIHIHNECTECEGDLVISENKRACQACGEVMASCTQCTAYDVCTSCATGFGVNETGLGCIVCDEAMANCSECETYERCTACGGELVVKGDNTGCQTCTEAMPDCSECEAYNNCTACDGEKILKEDGTGCQTCSDAMPGCTTCNAFNNCTQCDDSKELKDDNTGCKDTAALKEPSLMLMMLAVAVMFLNKPGIQDDCYSVIQ